MLQMRYHFRSYGGGVLTSLILHAAIVFISLNPGVLRYSVRYLIPEIKPIEVELVTETPPPPEPEEPKREEPVEKEEPPELTPAETEPPLPAEPPPLPEKPVVAEAPDIPQPQEVEKPPPPVLAPPPVPTPPAPAFAKPPLPKPPLPAPPKLEGDKIVKQAPSSSDTDADGKGAKGADKSAENLAPDTSVVERDGGFSVEDEKSKGGTEAGQAALDADGDPILQSERDFLLAQILKCWRYNYGDAGARTLVLNGTVEVLPDGMLAPPFNGTQRWDPQTALPQYAVAGRTGNRFLQQVLESFYLAAALRASSKFGGLLAAVCFRKLPFSGPTDLRISAKFLLM